MSIYAQPLLLVMFILTCMNVYMTFIITQHIVTFALTTSITYFPFDSCLTSSLRELTHINPGIAWKGGGGFFSKMFEAYFIEEN